MEPGFPILWTANLKLALGDRDEGGDQILKALTALAPSRRMFNLT